jgi:hypothetical protein
MRGEPECFALLEQQTEVLDEPWGGLGQVLEYSPATSHQTLQLSSCSIAVLGIRIRMFRALLNPDPLVRDMDLNPSIITQFAKNSKHNLDSYCSVTSFWLFMLEKLCKCTFKKYRIKLKKFEKKYSLLASWRSRTKIAESGAGIGSIGQRHGSMKTDPYQNVADPLQCFIGYLFNLNCLIFISYLRVFQLYTLRRVYLNQYPVPV